MASHGQLVRDDSFSPAGYNYQYISGTGVTLLKSSGAFLGMVSINSPTATSVITLYDSDSAVRLTGTFAVITIPSSPPTPDAPLRDCHGEWPRRFCRDGKRYHH